MENAARSGRAGGGRPSSGRAPGPSAALTSGRSACAPWFWERADERFGSWTAAPQRLLPPVPTPWVGLAQPAPHLVTYLQACWLWDSWWGRQSLGVLSPQPAGPCALARTRAEAGISRERDELWSTSPCSWRGSLGVTFQQVPARREGTRLCALLGRETPRRTRAAQSLWGQRPCWQLLVTGKGGAPARAGGGPGGQPDAGG